MHQPQHESNSKKMSSLLVLLASACFIILPSLAQHFQWGLPTRRSSPSMSSGSSSGRRLSSNNLGLRAKSSVGCGLWHPVVGGLKTCTNDLDYPLTWNSLSRTDKRGLFYRSATDCCMEHFQETAGCQIVDACDSNTQEDVSNNRSGSIIQGESTTSSSTDEDDDTTSSTSLVTTAYDISQYEFIDGPSIMRCDRWRPSEEEPGSCTNRILPGEVWPTSMYRKTQDECCSDFFKLESCSVVDVCATASS